MLKCSIGKQQQEKFAKKVASDLKEMLASGKPYDLKAHMLKIYNRVLELSNNEVKALDYARLVPIYIDQYKARQVEVKAALVKQEFASNELDKLIIDISKKKGLAKVKDYLNISLDNKEALEALALLEKEKKAEKKRKKKEKKKKKAALSAKPSEPVTSPSVWDQATEAVKKFFVNIWDSYAPTAFADTGLEVDRNGEPKTDNTKFLFTVKRNLIRALHKQPGGMDSSKLDYEKFGKVFMTAMSVSQIEDDLGNEVDLSKDPERKGVYMVLTRANGEPFKFDSEGLPTLEGGNIAYYGLRNNETTSSWRKSSDADKINALVKLRGVTYAVAKAQYEREIKAIDDIRAYIAKDPANNTVQTAITGGSLGRIETDFVNIRNPLSKATGDIRFKLATEVDETSGRGMKAGFTYFFGENGQPLQVERPALGVNKFGDRSNTEFDQVEMLLDLITGDLKDDLGNAVSFSERKRLVNQYLPLQSKFFNMPTPTSGGKYWITISGKRHTLDTPEQMANAREALKEYLTKPRIEREATRYEINKARKAKSLATARVNDVIQTESGKFYKVDQAKLHVLKELAANKNSNIQQPVLKKNDDGSFDMSLDEIRYTEFLKNNFYSSAEMSKDGKFRELNAYFTFAATEEGNKEIYAKDVNEAKPKVDEKLDTPPASSDRYIADDDLPVNHNLDNYFKIKAVKDRDKTATKKQVAEAKVWYENLKWKDPKTGKEVYMKNLLPYKEAFNLINTKNPNAVASFAVSGITLFEGSDYSDLYHEAWHGFSQAFMTKEQAADLYKEVRKKSGDFTTYTGKVVSFKDAKPLEIEEWLAEEFRSYMLGNQKVTKGAPKQNSLFRRIFNFLKALFSNTTVYEIGLNEQANATVNELFEKLRVGDINEYSFSADNVQFGELQSGILAIENRTGVNQINIEDTNTIHESIDAIFGEYIDLRNTGLNPKEQNELAKLKSQFTNGYYNRLTSSERTQIKKEDQKRLDELETNAKYKGVSEVVKNDKVRMQAYGYTHYRLSQIRDKEVEAYNNETNDLAKGKIKKNVDLLNFTLREFGRSKIETVDGKDYKVFLDINEQLPKAGEPVKGVIASHMFKSKLFADAELLEFGEVDEMDTYLAGREGYNRSGTENSLKALAKQEIIYLIQGLKATDKKGDEIKNRFGIPTLQPFTATWNRLARALQNSPSLDVMFDRLTEEAKTSPQVKQLLGRLGPNYREGISRDEMSVWTNFWQAFNKTRIPLIQMTVTRDQQGTGTVYTHTIGEAFNADYAIGKRWESQFQGARRGEMKYVKTDLRGNYLDINAILKDFPNKTLINNSFEFFQALGFDLTDTPEIREKLLEGAEIFGPVYFRRALVRWQETEQRNAYKNKNKRPKKLRSLYTLTKNLDKRFKSIQILESKYSDIISNFMVTNAENNTQFEHSLNNTMTVMVNGLNDTTKDYQEIIDQRHLAHLDVEKNPFAASSLWIKSMFVLDVPKDHPDYGIRRLNDVGEKVTLRLTNLSGVLIKDKDESSRDGIAAAKSDAYTKLILDLHLSYYGTPEMMRHADKGTAYSLSLDGPIVGSDSKQYVPAYLFSKDSESAYQMKTYERMLPHIIAEMKRMREMRKMSGIEEYDFKYAEDGQNFTIFDDVLDGPTIRLLEKIVDSNQDIETVIQENLNIRQALQEQVTNYFEKQYKANKKLFKNADFASSTIIAQLQKEAKDKGINMNDAAAKDALIRSYTNNNFIHNVESLAMFYGDLALYNHAKEGFHKRNAGAGSTGDLYRTDNAMQQYLNSPQVRGTSYAKKMQTELDLSDDELGVYDGTMKTAIVADQNVKSAYYDEYVKALGEAGAYAYGENKKGVGQMTEADAQGLVTFDAYRELKLAEGDWSDKQDELFNDIVNGKKVNPKQVTEFFPVIKAQYWGPLQTPGMSLMGMHKYSLMPLIPTVVKNKNAEALHHKMIKEGIKYLTFESGSKVSTISKKSGPDLLYAKDRTLALDKPFTPNVIHLEYLKNQLAISSKTKGNVIFSTQLRKLIETGLMEGGVPSDFMTDEKDMLTRIEAWNGVKDKEAESPRYKLALKYERNITKLTQFHKDKLLKEMNWTSKIVNGKEQLDGNIGDLVKMVKKELGSRDELAQHELDFIDIVDGKLKHDLSLSFSVEKIEKMLNAIMVKRLIKQKVNGEGLIQVASTLFEEMNGAEGYGFSNATAEDIAKYNKKNNGTNDLPTYREGEGKNGETSAMKVKVALLNDFTHLLDLNDLDGKRIGSIENLNKLIKNEAWLDEGRHREMITMVGVRIPVQGLNSMEFMEIYEFLPPEAGSIIIPPSEIVAKSGADFDVDKMTIMMPNIRKPRKENGLTVGQPQMWNYNKKELAEAYEFYKEAKLKKERGGQDLSSIEGIDTFLASLVNKETGQSLFGTAEEMEAELLEMLMEEGTIESPEDFSKRMLSDKAIQNDLISDVRSILALPENFNELIRPNSTDIFDELAADLGPLVNDYDQYDTIHGKTRMNGDNKMISPTRTLEVGYNLFKHVSNAIGKETLGLGAVDNTYNSVFNRIGMYMNPTAGMTTAEYEAELNKAKPDKKILSKYRRQKLFLTHNTRRVGNEKGISLSHIMDANGEHKVSDVINQMMNGWVDIAADAWIFNIQANKEVSPVLLFMIQAGVPVKEAVYFASMPLVREYVKEMKFAKSTFAQPLGKEAGDYGAQSSARERIMTNPMFGFDMSLADASYPNLIMAQAEARVTEDVLNDKGTFSEQGLYDIIKKESAQRKKGDAYQYTDVDRAAFLHFLEIEEMAKAVRDVKMKMNVDTSKDGSLFEAQNRVYMKESLREDSRIPTEMIDKIITDSPIGSFFIQPFQIESLGKMFPLRNDESINDFIMKELRKDFNVAKDTSGDPEKLANDFKNDLPLYLFQNAIRGTNIKDLKFYNGRAIKSATVKNVASLEYGAFVEDGVMYIDQAELNRQFVNKTFQNARQRENESDKAFEERKIKESRFGLAKVPSVAFQKPEEYFKFVLERESLRASVNVAEAAETTEFKTKLNFMNGNAKQRENETATAFEERKVRLTYESWLKDKALDNAYNYWNMFKSGNTYAQQYETLIKAHPDLADNFSLINVLSSDVAADMMFKNLSINNTKLTVDEIDQLHENLVNLSDPAKFTEIVEGKTKAEIREITEFFKKMPVIAFLQSGMNTRSKYSLIRIVPQKPIMDMISKPIKGFMSVLKKDGGKYVLPEFFREFKSQNNRSSGQSKIRGKNYFTGTDISAKGWVQKSIKQEDLAIGFSSGSAYNPKQTTYDPTIGRVALTKIAADNPNTLYVYNQARTTGGGNLGDSVLDGMTNAFGIETRVSYGDVAGRMRSSIIRDLNGAIDPFVKEAIDENLTMLEEAKSQGMKIVFNKEGYGQDMQEKNKKGNMFAPETFVYLSEQLLERLEYLNPGFVETKEGVDLVQAKQKVSDVKIVEKNDQAVRDYMNQCMG